MTGVGRNGLPFLRVLGAWGTRGESRAMNGIIYLVGLVVVVLAVLGFLGIR
ncbi:hypothetical protein [Phenylobacterium sp.]|uniref:hypothetical protein n=1 Tax=Phenylobacterium sp. TaxID=1871053 RepID=UPI0025F3F93D|nr:hypothetical protein [Phenylobacterium sp.]MBX3483366.1 hypothetical protein [Phenylobacterium sp.]